MRIFKAVVFLVREGVRIFKVVVFLVRVFHCKSMFIVHLRDWFYCLFICFSNNMSVCCPINGKGH